MPEHDIRPVSGPHVWRGADLAGRRDWIHPFPATVLGDLDRLAAGAARRGENEDTFDFRATDIPSLHDYCAGVRAALGEGCGFALMRGLPVHAYDMPQLKIMLLVIGHHIGLVGPQGNRAAGIGEVMDTDSEGRREYYYHVGGPLPMHMDPVDVVGLLCVRAAKRGGESRIASSMAVHNEILRTRPDYLRLYYRGFHNYRKVDKRAGQGPMTDHPCPLFAEVGGRLICSYIPSPIVQAVEAGLMTLSPEEEAALDTLERTASRPDMTLEMGLLPGDVQFLNNRHILHNRADYEDFPEVERRRLLLRVWLTMPGWAKYPPNVPHFDVELQNTGAR